MLNINFSMFKVKTNKKIKVAIIMFNMKNRNKINDNNIMQIDN